MRQYRNTISFRLISLLLALACLICVIPASYANTTVLDPVTITGTLGHATGNILYWDRVPNATLYQVYRLEGSRWVLVENTDDLGYKDTTAPADVKSYYKIVARNGAAKSDIKATASTGVIRVTRLNNVTVTKTIGHGSGNILYWDAVENALIYQVYRLNGTSWEFLKNTGSLGYKDETAPESVKCYYKIIARNGAVKSDIKTTVSTGVTRAHKHNYILTETIQPGCEEYGWYVYTCKCGDTYKDCFSMKLGHNWSEWTVVKEPTPEEQGERTRSCLTCAEVQNQPLIYGREIVDTDVLEEHGRTCAAELGFTIDTSLGRTNSGYLPSISMPINTMARGRELVAEDVTGLRNTLARWIYLDGHTDDPDTFPPGIFRFNCEVEYLWSDMWGDWYFIYCYYA